MNTYIYTYTTYIITSIFVSVTTNNINNQYDFFFFFLLYRVYTAVYWYMYEGLTQ